MIESGVADPEIIAANQARRSPFQRFSTLDEAQEARRAGDDKSYRDWETDRKSTRLNSSHRSLARMPSSA